MSTTLHPPGFILFQSSVYPAEVDDTDVGTTLDFDGYGSWVAALQTIGAVNGTNPTLAGKIQESHDGSTWVDIAGAVFATVTASNNFQIIEFMRTRRYLRHARTVTGTTPTFVLSASIGCPSKPYCYLGAA